MTSYNRFSVQVPTGTVLNEGPVFLLEPSDTLAPEDTVATPELQSQIKNTELESFQLVPGSIDPNILGMTAVGLFNELPDLGLTRGESAHDVRFGQLIVRSFLGDERAELASLKPFDMPKEAAHEFSLARYFMGAGKSHGFRTFMPLGVTRFSTGEYGILSRYEHGVISLDNIFWNPDNDLESPLVGRAIGKAAYSLAALHAAGWTHGDPQIKNTFVSNHSEAFIADLESMKPFKHRQGTIDELAVKNDIDRDLRILAESLTHKRDETDSKLPSQIAEIFSLIYIGITNSPHSRVPVDVRKSHDEVGSFFDGQY